MIPFSDDDLKRLKQFIEDVPAGRDFAMPSVTVLRDLLARLEAAEQVCHCAEELKREDRNLNALLESVKAWRKACGK